MKPEELQLGDIVTTTPSGMPIKVAAIHRKKVAYHARTDRFSWVRIGLLQPIPLTAEILGKNFKSTELPDDPYGAYFFGGDDKIKIYIREHTDGLWKVDVDEIEIGGMRSWRMYVSNVHELQHVIRLCEIDKEIEL